MQCSNCSTIGHSSKQCPQPITSYGAILFRVRDLSWNQPEILLKGDRQALNTLEAVQGHIEYFMIQRKDSIGFVEIMRGKYKLSDLDYIRAQIAGMTALERERLLSVPFDKLWEDLWGPPQAGTHAYRNEKDHARGKLEALRAGTPSLAQLVREAPPALATPEWGFPKGRREAGESEYICAMRELWEETNIKERDICTIRNVDPIAETFFGSNHVHYCHKYFLAYAPPGVGEEPFDALVRQNPHIVREIGDVRWMSLEDALAVIRPESTEKRELLLRVSSILRSYCPLRAGSGGREKRAAK
jgi:8-oxo-dGTP pyrophosphatase MutT (NUDIX family)